MLGAQRVAIRIGEIVFERAIGTAVDPVEVSRRLVQRADVWSVVLGIGGLVSLVVVVGIARLTLGDGCWGY